MDREDLFEVLEGVYFSSSLNDDDKNLKEKWYVIKDNIKDLLEYIGGSWNS